MDFLDPRKQRQHSVLLMVGYVFITAAIFISTMILLYEAYGFGLDKNGQVIQKGFVYVSSQPTGSEISLNGQLNNSRTNTRLSLVSGSYAMKISRTDYRDWQRNITVIGGSVEHFDYPLLIPNKLVTNTIKSYDTTPGLATQSPDKRWVLVQQPGSTTVFDEYDLKNPKQAPTTLTLPDNLKTSGAAEAWQLVEWSTDNRHVLLQHAYDDKTEYILVDRSDPTQSLNLDTTLKTTPTKLTLINKKYDQYYVYDGTNQTLQTTSLGDTAIKPYLEHVLDYKSYGSNIMLYASSNASSSSKVAIDLLQDGKTYSLREVSANTTYLLNLTQYDGDWFVALGASSESKVYVYKNPTVQLNSRLGALVPIYVLKASNPTYLAFSDNAQFVMDENGSQFSVYDAQYDQGYNYDTKLPLDNPQPHATWMDGDRLIYSSGGKLRMFDYDHANLQTLMGANPGYLPFFDPNYHFVDTFTTADLTGKINLTTTALLTPADQ